MKYIRLAAAFMALAVISARAAEYMKYHVKTSGEPTVGAGQFFGYKSSTEGPGGDAFDKCLRLAEEKHRPLLWIVGKDNCAGCSAFAAAANTAVKAFAPGLGQRKVVAGYFRGKDDKSGPAACNKAWAFFNDSKMSGKVGTPGSCHAIGFYGLFEDGVVMARVGSVPTGGEPGLVVSAFTLLIKGWADEFDREYDKHLYTPPKGNAGFACGAGDYTRLEMVSNATESVFVPFTRTNNLTNVETNWLAVTYAGETVASTNIQFVWSATGPSATNLEVEVDVSAVTRVGDRVVRLEYLNWEGASIATNWIACVGKAPDGALTSPWLPGAKSPEDLAWGEWTLDFAAATNKAAQAKDACLLVALCGTTWDATALSIWAGFTGGDDFNTRFASFCRTNQIATVLIDREDPATGASVFTHAVSRIGRSGTPFLSRNGLCSTNETVRRWKAGLKAIDAAYRKAPASASGGLQSELLLLRADGSVVGRLNPYCNNGVYDGDEAPLENRDRIFELFDLRKDANEELNNDPSTTTMTLAYGGKVSGNTLHVSDTRDVFLLTGVPAGTAVKLSITQPEQKGGAQEIAFTRTLVRFTDKTHRAWTTVAPTTRDGAGRDVWIFREEADTKELAVIVSGFENAAGIQWDQRSTTAYDIEFGPAAANEGDVDFCDGTRNPVGVVVSTDWTNVTLFVERTGYTGAKDVTVDIDKNPRETTATNGCYIWKAPVALHWDDLEAGVKSFTLTLTNDHEWVESGDIHFIFSNDTSKDYYLTVEPREDPNAPVGDLAITDPPIPSEILYLEEGTNLAVTLSRVGGRRGELVGRLSATEGGLSPTNEFIWPKYDDDPKKATWRLPMLDGAAKLEATLTLSGNSNGVPIRADADRLKVCLLPANAPKFVAPAEDGVSVLQLNAVQYVNASGQIGLEGGVPSGWRVKGVRNISGSLPDGLSVSWDDKQGALRVSGQTVMQSGWSESTWWLTFSDEAGKISYSYPVRIACNVQSLESLNPGFAQTRTWTGFPLYIYRLGDDSDHMRLVGAMDLTVRKDGTTSAKIRELGNKVLSFAADGLTSINVSGAEEFDTGVTDWESKMGLAYIRMTEVYGGRTYTLHLYFYANGAMGVRLDDPDYVDEQYILQSSCNEGTVNWGEKLADGSIHTAEPWKGVYSMAFPINPAFGLSAGTLCYGATSVQARFLSASQWKTGRATYAGVLPNGRTFSGSSTFVPRQPGVELLCLPMLTLSAADEFAALVAVSNGTEAACVVAAVPSEAADTDAGRVFDLVTRWNHSERGFPTLSYSNDYTVVGSRFTVTNDWRAVWGAERLAFGVDGVMTDAGLVPDDWRIKSDDKALSVSLNRSSGAMMGVFRVSEDEGRIWRPYQWKGSAMPGCEPFLLGAYWCNFPTNVQNSAGDEVRKTVRIGGSVGAAAEVGVGQ